jgi:DHA1 family tetracycline resistance protein-like MFS transporter
MRHQTKSNAGMGFAVATIFVDAIGIGLIFPIMPDLLADLGIKTVSDAALYGAALSTVYAVMQFLFLPILGNLSDQIGRRPVLLIGIAALFVDYLIMGVASSYALLFIGRLVAGIAGATVATATSYIADVSAPNERAQNFGIMGATFGIGFIIGPALGGLLGAIDIRLPFFAAAGFAGLNFTFGLFVLPESLPPEKRRAFTWQRANPFKALKRAATDPALRHPVFVIFCMMLAGYVYPAVWSFYGKEKFGWDTALIGFSLAGYGLAVAFVQGVLIRFMLPKWGERGTVRFGLVSIIIAMLGIAFATDTWMIFAMITMAALGEVAGPAINGILSKLVSEREQGDLQGTLGSIESLAAIIAPPVFASMFNMFSDGQGLYFPGAPFLAAALISGIALIVFHKSPKGTP